MNRKDTKTRAQILALLTEGNTNKKVVRIGQGNIADRLTAHRQDRAILQHKANGLYATWAAVPSQSVDGVERYLYDQYGPLAGERAPDVHPIAVNLVG